MESVDVILLLPWLMVHARRFGARQRDAGQHALEGAKIEHASWRVVTREGWKSQHAPFRQSRAR